MQTNYEKILSLPCPHKYYPSEFYAVTWQSKVEEKRIGVWERRWMDPAGSAGFRNFFDIASRLSCR